MNKAYDSRVDTRKHINEVRKLLQKVIANLRLRAFNHDASKLNEPEKSTFDLYTPKLRNTTYGSEEYKCYLEAMKPALDHHYSHNQHHPEFWANGIRDMSLLDIIEMLCDWKAATLRHADGSLAKSIEINQKRFGYSDEMKNHLILTATELGLFN